MSINKDNNEFEGKLKIRNFSSKEELLEKINSYCGQCRSGETDNLYDIEKENANFILLNFHKDTDLANFVNRSLKLLQIENSDYSNITSNLIIKVINPQNEKDKQNKKEKEETNKSKSISKGKKKKIINNIKLKDYSNDVYNIDAKDNPRLNKLLRRNIYFNKKNINKYMSPENTKMKIYESIFFAGPYVNKSDIIKEENRKNKALWLNKKGFVPYISKKTILENEHMIGNILYQEPAQDKPFKFRPVQKSKWIGNQDFLPYA